MSSYSRKVNDEDELLERIKQESLKHYQEVELPRIKGESIAKLNQNVDNRDLPVCAEAGEVSDTNCYEGSEAEGFYLLAGSSYIYPTNYPVREYQDSIVHSALFKNTLVSLPTGLGKTFIAAVVMYNYYRWYPKGKVVFMAPTRPLVAQQIKACCNIMGLPLEDTTEMTGNLNVKDRIILWKSKRVFFLTPQVMVNDIRSKSCPAKLVKCLVVDEAHRAVKDYAYCHVVSLLDEEEAIYRILALSATPGNDVTGVQQIIKNLKISSLEFRGEDALDVIKYTHQKNVESIAVNLSINIQRVKGDFLQIYDKYAKRLRDCKAMICNISTVTKFQILKTLEKFRAHPPRGLAPTALGIIVCDFSVCMSLAHALELLQIYGLRAFHSYLSDGGDKNKSVFTRLKNDTDLEKMLDRLKQILSKNPGEEGYIWGHPKLYKLTSVLAEHFNSAKELGEKTKAIIFCQYRVVVVEVLDVLKGLNPDIKPVMFIGQSSTSKERGMTQSKQLEIMKDFRTGVYNCMIATCVAEEGLDIGEVDLIVLMEAHKSPIRLVQRIGRTGRKRKGKCIVLVTEGREEYKFQEAMAARKSYVSSVLSAKSVRGKLYPNSPCMFPPGIKPTKQLQHIDVVEYVSPKKPGTSKQVDIRACLVSEESPFLTSEEYKTVTQELSKKRVCFNKIPVNSFLFHRMNNGIMHVDELLKKDSTVFSEWNDWNLQLHEIHELSHSSESELMCGLLNRFYTFDIKFFNLNSEIEKDSKLRRIVTEEIDEDTEDELLTTRKRRKNRKEAEKTNFGMDIRHCLATAKDKAKIQRKYDPNEIIDVEDPNCVENNDVLIDEVIQSLEKELQLSSLTSPEFLKLNSSFQDCTVNTLDSFSSIPTKKKNVTMFSIFTKLRSKQETVISEILSELECLKVEFAANKTEDEMEEILHPDIFWDNESVKSEKGSQKSLDNFVGLDDLLDEKKETGNSAGQKLNNEAIANFDCKNEMDTLHSPLRKNLDHLWESLPEELLDFKPSVTPNRNKYLAASTPINNKFIMSPKKTLSEINLVNEIESPIPKSKTEEEVVWNLDDLFEDEDIDCNTVANPEDSQISEKTTLIGITQMVSMIEHEKIVNKLNAVNWNDTVSNKIILKDSENCKPSSNEEDNCNYNEEKVKEDYDQHLLDEDDDFFTQIPNIEVSPVKNVPLPRIKNVSQKFIDNSVDMFASTICQSKLLGDEHTVEQDRKDIQPEGDFISDINDILDNDNDDDSDDHIIISDDEETSTAKGQHLISSSAILQNIKQATKTNKTVLISVHTASNLNVHSEENDWPIEENTTAEVHINPPNFKRFVSNKNKPVMSQLPSNSINKQQQPQAASFQTRKVVTRNENTIKSEFPNNVDITDEGWWFDFDFPSNCMKKGSPVTSKPEINCVTRENVPTEASEADSQRKKLNVCKITDFIKPQSEAESTKIPGANSKIVDILYKSERGVKESKYFQAQSNLKMDSTIANNCDITDESLNNHENGMPGKGKSTLNSSTETNDKSDDTLKKAETFTSSKENISRTNSDTLNSNKYLSLDNSKDEEIFRDVQSSSDRPRDSEEIVSDNQRRLKQIQSPKDHRKKKRRKRRCNFIEVEAEVSDDCSISSGNDDSSGLDDLEHSFIDDDQENDVSIHAKYLQSVKSQVHGKFKIPCRSNTINCDVYSQDELNDSEYVNDSFCVGSDESSGENELSAIEIAERKLEKKRKMKTQNNLKPKRRRIRILSPNPTSFVREESFESEVKSSDKSQPIDLLKQKKKKFCILSDSDGTASDTSPLFVNKKNNSAPMNNKTKLAQVPLKINSKKCLNFSKQLMERTNKYVSDNDEELEKVLRESQQEYENNQRRLKEREDKELEEVLLRSKVDVRFNQPSTSGLR